MLLYPRNQVSTSAGAEQLSLSVSYCIKSLKFSGTIMSLRSLSGVEESLCILKRSNTQISARRNWGKK